MNLRQRLQVFRVAAKEAIAKSKSEQPKEKVKEVIQPVVEEPTKTKKKKGDV
jgi:hypothetical protein